LSPDLKENLIRVLRILLFLAIGGFFLFLAFRDIPLDHLVSGLMSARYGWVLISLSLATLAFISRALRWILLIEPLGYRPSAQNTFYALMTGYLANFVLPRIGEITRCGSLNRTDRIPVSSLLGTVIIERIADFLVLLLLAAMVFFIKLELLGNFFFNYIINPFIQTVTSLFELHPGVYLLALALPVLLFVIYRRFSAWLKEHKIFRKLEQSFMRVIEGMKSVLKMKKIKAFLFHTIFIWLMYLMMTWALLMALPSTETLGLTGALFILVAGGLGMAAPVQGGIGTYHWIVSVGLGIYGISREDGLIFATLSHESQSILMIILGLLSMLMVFLKWKKLRQGDDIPAQEPEPLQAEDMQSNPIEKR
jgi:glycosyltransferase 2 family protein